MSSLLRRWLPVVLAIVSLLALVPLSTRADSMGPERDKMKQVLNVVAKEIEKEYYDPSLHGLDWKALVDEARRKIDAAQNPGQMLTAIYVLVDKLKDSHTVFIPPSRSTHFIFGFEAKMYGDEARIWKVKKNGSAEKAGLKPGDKLVSVMGNPPERQSFDLMMLYYRVLRPVPVMDLVVQRDQESPRSIRLQPEIRKESAVVDLATEEDYGKLFQEADVEDEEYRKDHQFRSVMHDETAYVFLPEFTGEKERMQGLLQNTKNGKAIVIDLRGNRGGSQDTLATYAGFFESEPLVMANVVGRKKTEPVKIKPSKPNIKVPMFILVDSESASAAEIFAHHFQQKGRAVVIGDQSAGAVMVAKFFPESIGAGSQILFETEITVGRFVFPDGKELEKAGVQPDHLCLPKGEDMRAGRDTCLSLAYQLAEKAIAAAGPAAPTGK
jgi:carboxyl-terminal processing protease